MYHLLNYMRQKKNIIQDIDLKKYRILIENNIFNPKVSTFFHLLETILNKNKRGRLKPSTNYHVFRGSKALTNDVIIVGKEKPSAWKAWKCSGETRRKNSFPTIPRTHKDYYETNKLQPKKDR